MKSAQLQGAYLESAQLQGAYLKSAQLQGAYLESAQLQGVSSTDIFDYYFNNRKQKKANITHLSSTVLTQQKANEIISSIPISNRFSDSIEIIKQRLQKAIGKNPIQWVKDQEGINLGILSEEEFNKIAESITEPKARKRMGLPPLKTTPSH